MCFFFINLPVNNLYYIIHRRETIHLIYWRELIITWVWIGAKPPRAKAPSANTWSGRTHPLPTTCKKKNYCLCAAYFLQITMNYIFRTSQVRTSELATINTLIVLPNWVHMNNHKHWWPRYLHLCWINAQGFVKKSLTAPPPLTRPYIKNFIFFFKI